MFSVLGWGGLVVLLLVAGVGGTPTHAQQQEVPDSIRNDLEARNLSPDQARRRARQLGLDLSAPVQAADEARRRGIPEARVRALLRAARAASTMDTTAQSLSASDVAAMGVAPPDTTPPASKPPAPDTTADGDQPGALSYFGYATFDNVPDAFAPSSSGPSSCIRDRSLFPLPSAKQFTSPDPLL